MNPALLSLLQLSDPALPIGGYAHSGGLETYVQEGLVHDVASARDFVVEMLRNSIFYTDAALVVLAHEARNEIVLQELDALCEAVKLPREIREASRKLGSRLLKIFAAHIGGKYSTHLGGKDIAYLGGKGISHYPVVFGYCAASMQIPVQETLLGFYYNAAAGMITNCVKLIPIGQQDGQQLLLSLQPMMLELVEKGLKPDKNLIGRSCTGLDIRCMQHEKLYSRLYMS